MTDKLLLDQNLSRRLVTFLQIEFPETTHVTKVKLSLAADAEVWEYAQKNEFCILSKDADFHHMSLLYGAPPKVIWLRLGNCTTNEIQFCLVRNMSLIKQFLKERENAILVLN